MGRTFVRELTASRPATSPRASELTSFQRGLDHRLGRDRQASSSETPRATRRVEASARAREFAIRFASRWQNISGLQEIEVSEVPTPRDLKAWATRLQVRSLGVVFLAIIEGAKVYGFVIMRGERTVLPEAYKLWEYDDHGNALAAIFDIIQMRADVEADPPRASDHIRRRLLLAAMRSSQMPKAYRYFIRLGTPGRILRQSSQEHRRYL